MLIKIVVLSMIIERVWEHIQQLLGDGFSKQTKVIGSGILSVAAAVALQLDLLYALDVMPAETYPGYIMTGLVLGLGSNVLHDVIDLVTGYSKKQRG